MFDMERIEAVFFTGGSDKCVVKVKWVGLEEEKTWEPVSTNYDDAPKYLVGQLRKIRLTKKVRDDIKKKPDMNVRRLNGCSVRGPSVN